MAETQTATEAEKKLRRNKRLEYPLNNPDDYLGRLVFTVLEEPPTELGNIVGTVTKAGEALQVGLRVRFKTLSVKMSMMPLLLHEHPNRKRKKKMR